MLGTPQPYLMCHLDEHSDERSPNLCDLLFVRVGNLSHVFVMTREK